MSDVLVSGEVFNEDYFMNGVATGISNYENYQWLPDKTIPMVRAIKRYLDIRWFDSVLDFGCSRGYVVKAFRTIGVSAFGMDISKWAIKNCDPAVKPYVGHKLGHTYSFILSKDVLEHISHKELSIVVSDLMSRASRALFIVVPLAVEDNGDYVCPRDEADMTHKIRWTLTTWIEFLQETGPEFVVNGSFSIPGVKDAAKSHPRSCGFITCKRLCLTQ